MAVIIGAIVIASFLGPNLALSLATVRGDTKLAIDSIKSNYIGFLIAFILSICIELIFTVDPTTQKLL